MKALYFTVKDLEATYERAKALKCLSREDVHDAPGGGIVVRPWGEVILRAGSLGESLVFCRGRNGLYGLEAQG